MISTQGRGRLRWERLSISPFIAPSIAPLDSSLPPKSEISKLPDGLLRPKFPAATSVPNYFQDDLQRILKAVLEARAPALAPTLALVNFEVPQEKVKAHSPDVYRRKSHIDCYNFCQQCKDYFATIRATGPTQILFATSFFGDRISLCWQ